MTQKDMQNLSQFYSGFRLLGPLITGSKSLQEDVDHLAAFIRDSVPLCHILLVRLTAKGVIQEQAAWSGSQVPASFCREFLDNNLSEILSSFGRSGSMDFDRLLELADRQVQGGEMICRPAVFPIAHEGKIQGMAFFGKRRALGPWERTERQFLEALMSVISVSFAIRNSREEHSLQSWVLDAVMNDMKASLYVTDIRTDKILYMNKKMKDDFGLENPEGELCWKVLQQGRESRCEFCPVPILQAGGENSPGHYIWEENNSVTGRIYENHDCLMKWLDGSTVHFQQSIDVTDSKVLRKEADTDDLTEMLNRRAGKKKLGDSMEDARRNGQTLTVAMYDVNGLKEINDEYGHVEGDRMLRRITRAVKDTLGPTDYCFRLSGDEFIVSFPGSTEQEAARRIERARDALRNQGGDYETGFCCGFLQIPPELKLTVPEALSQVDERMYEQKRRHHIQLAKASMGNGRKITGKFTYPQELLYGALSQSTEDYVYICNLKTNTFRYPPAMVEEFGLPGEVIENAAAVWGDKVHENDKQAFLEANQDITDGRTDSHCVEYRAMNCRGEWVWMRCRGHVERDENGDAALFAGMITNLGKKDKIDHLTGLYNKFEFEEEIQRLTKELPDHRLGILTVGLDNFKQVNNLYNRVFGDEILRISSQRIQSMLPVGSTVYRLDGDEFGILMRDGGREEAEKLYGILQSWFAHQRSYEGNRYYCTVSAGFSQFPQDGADYLRLQQNASYSLEFAKLSGKNRMVCYSRQLLDSKQYRLKLTQALRESVEHDFAGFRVSYQLQVDALTGCTKGCEALGGWECAEFGRVPPIQFIPMLEENNMIAAYGRWVFRKAVEQCAQWSALCSGFTMSINVSSLQLDDPGLFPYMREVLAQTGADPSSITLELTESYIAANVKNSSEFFIQARALGMKLAIDDFGTGYSSLSLLKNLRVDVVKIDKAFVRDIGVSSFDAAFIRLVVELCHDVEIKVCLEGVEHQAEYELIRPMGVDWIQGFYFGRPQLPEEFEAAHLSPFKGEEE